MFWTWGNWFFAGPHSIPVATNCKLLQIKCNLTGPGRGRPHRGMNLACRVSIDPCCTNRDDPVRAHPAGWKAGELASLRTEGTPCVTRGVEHNMHIHVRVSMSARCSHRVFFRLQSGTLKRLTSMRGAQVCHRARPCASSVHFRPSLYAARCAASL